MAKVSEKAESKLVTRPERKPPQVALDWDDKDRLDITLTGNFERLAAATANADVRRELIWQLATLGPHGERVDAGAANFALGFVDSMKPRDPAEALLTAQMAAVHQATMMLAQRLNHADNIPQQDAAERALNKLARTFTAQMDTLKRYRSKGQQTVRVERVTVQDGGQAIVGSVMHGGRADDGT